MNMQNVKIYWCHNMGNILWPQTGFNMLFLENYYGYIDWHQSVVSEHINSQNLTQSVNILTYWLHNLSALP